jgi:hypothetical protein
MKSLALPALALLCSLPLAACVAGASDDAAAPEESPNDTVEQGDPAQADPAAEAAGESPRSTITPHVSCGFTHNQFSQRGDWYRNCLARCAVIYASVNPTVAALFDVPSKYFSVAKGASYKIGNVGNYDWVAWIRWC